MLEEQVLDVTRANTFDYKVETDVLGFSTIIEMSEDLHNINFEKLQENLNVITLGTCNIGEKTLLGRIKY